MRHVPAIAGRELRAMFSTPVAYVVFAVYLVFAGFIFFSSLGSLLIWVQRVQAFGALQMLAQVNLNDTVIANVFYTFGFTFIVMIPLLSMRALAEERTRGTIELLLTSPITVWEIVLGKYLSVLVMVVLLVALTAGYPALLFWYGDPELWQTIAGLLSLLLYGAALAAIGCFVSALSQSQIIAGMVGIVAGLILLVLPAAAESTQNESMRGLLEYLGTSTHLEAGLRGEVRFEDLVYFGAVIAIFLALARAAVESLRWR